MKKIVLIMMFIYGVLVYAVLTPEEILKKSDEQIFPENFSYDMMIQTESSTGKIKVRKMKGYKKGQGKNVVIVKEPKRQNGLVHLRKEDTIYIYFKTNGKIMKSAFQSLALGDDVSYGDILASELSYDYDVKKFEESETEYMMLLEPKPDHKGYAKVKLYLDKKTYLPKKREYFALSGVLLKVLEFEKIEFDKSGVVRNIREKVYDPLKEKNNYIELNNITYEKDISEKYYNKNQMKFTSKLSK